MYTHTTQADVYTVHQCMIMVDYLGGYNHWLVYAKEHQHLTWTIKILILRRLKNSWSNNLNNIETLIKWTSHAFPGEIVGNIIFRKVPYWAFMVLSRFWGLSGKDPPYQALWFLSKHHLLSRRGSPIGHIKKGPAHQYLSSRSSWVQSLKCFWQIGRAHVWTPVTR